MYSNKNRLGRLEYNDDNNRLGCRLLTTIEWVTMNHKLSDIMIRVRVQMVPAK